MDINKLNTPINCNLQQRFIAPTTLQSYKKKSINFLQLQKMARMAMMVLCVVVTCMVVAAPYAEAISCGQVTSKLVSCYGYLTKGGVVPPNCCSGVKGLNSLAKTTADRQAICNCLKSAASSNINAGNAASLPGKCGVNIPYKISPSTDCTKVQ
ncbi:putative plant non-specific lipid-transfer protein/Par allergen [Helianthus annuus]|nr:putative plant non-specific lipid-transfer protein/Par allergen [Helianthus annuus]KAJ0802970.1 putative plant non-specific lipid-transfer protein/Par allergen [Helianthus annuus]